MKNILLLFACAFFKLSSALNSTWKSGQGRLYMDGSEVFIRGISWFGFETQDFVINGLWIHSMEWYIDLLVDLGINAIRLPFSSEWIYYNPDIYPYDGFVSQDQASQHKKSIEILDHFFDLTEKKGIAVLLDLHRLHKEYISELWYSPTDRFYTTETFFETWFTILDRYKNRRNLMGIDLLNEPHGLATFGTGDPSTDWRLFVQDAIPQIAQKYPKHQWLFFIEGIEWGHTFRDYNNHPFDFPETIMNRIVFSPHVYGKSVVPTLPSDPFFLRQAWENDFGFLTTLGYTVVPGEWGGKTSIDMDWMNNFISYLIDKEIHNNFFWSLGPNSGDVGGLLLDNWTDVDQFKINLLQQLQGNPTRFNF